MKFESQICTTKGQSERLLALGLKKETADMAYQCIGVSPYKVWYKSEISDNLFPAWSLHRLIELSCMGIIETTTDNLYDKVIQYIEYLMECESFNKEYLEQ